MLRARLAGFQHDRIYGWWRVSNVMAVRVYDDEVRMDSELVRTLRVDSLLIRNQHLG